MVTTSTVGCLDMVMVRATISIKDMVNQDTALIMEHNMELKEGMVPNTGVTLKPVRMVLNTEDMERSAPTIIRGMYLSSAL